MDETTWADTVADKINGWVEPFANVMGDIVFFNFDVGGATIMPIVLWLVIAGLIFSVYFGLAQVRHLKTALKVVRGKFDSPNAPGEVTHFQALTSALSGTVGLGNIAGVAIAISIGGPGAVFWMILCGLLGMATKFAECTLGVRYRVVHADGTVSGGPMHYLRKGLAERGLPGLGKVLAWGSALMIVAFTFFGGNLFQVNQSLEQLTTETGGGDSFFAGNTGAILYGIVLSVLVGLVILGGMKSIGKVTSRLVPSMAIMYVSACLIVILWNITAVPDALMTIVTEAFNPSGIAGGLLGALIVGFQRAAFSNEAGIGSAPIAHSAVKTKRPATEGLVAMLEPFIDTVVICTMTAVTIIVASGPLYEARRAGDDSINGIAITADAFQTALPWFSGLLTLAVILFAFSTLITWSYYGLKSWAHIFGGSRTSEMVYKALFCGMVIIGALLPLMTLVDLTDSFLFLAAVFNIIGLYLLAPVVKHELNRVLEYIRRREAGETDEEIDASEAASVGAPAGAGDDGEPGEKVTIEK
ncbi:amino acid carrier protein [Streptomyces alkaliphilus]|uniref:Amino acid carrier protein n=1 Tax=Streptomyces alkaliphilus TaxID=1472722 RepID=A0A7W3TEX3_9ACTN|nr:alanine/glycine:cation symporter family protein [Streptomyces alkaliphilus]MBB0245594.1 amino acid carrier protein [Streptomyces alkaliphilus]